MTSGFRVYDLAYAAAIVAIGLIAGTALAHVFEMPHKMAMSGDVWLSIQSVIYNGWGEKLLYLDIVAIAGLTFCIIRNSLARKALLLSLLLLLIADIGIFLIWIAPTNEAVDAWASITPMNNWVELRQNWEWGHAARAGVLSLALFIAGYSKTSSSDAIPDA